MSDKNKKRMKSEEEKMIELLTKKEPVPRASVKILQELNRIIFQLEEFQKCFIQSL